MMLGQSDDRTAALCAPEPPGARTAVCLAQIDGLATEVTPDEAEMVARSTAVRQQEFASGRTMARVALRRIGVAAAAIPRGQDRAPIWPENAVGSISHCRHLACAVASADALATGIDVECMHRLSPALEEVLFTPGERARLAGEPEPTLVFSAKEAIFKAVFPLLGAQIGFQEVEVALDLGRGRFQARYIGAARAHGLINRLWGGLRHAEGHVLTLAVLETPR